MDAAGNKTGGRQKGTPNDFPRAVSAPTAAQQTRIDKAREQYKLRSKRFSMLSEHKAVGENAMVSSPHTDLEGWKLTELDAFGTTSEDFADQLFGEVGWVAGVKSGVLQQQATNAACQPCGRHRSVEQSFWTHTLLKSLTLDPRRSETEG